MTFSSEFIQTQVDIAIPILQRGGVVAYPTDTLYGLGAGIYLPKAVQWVYTVKQRPPTSALPVLLADTVQLEEVCRDIPDIAWTLAEKFWPGALTLILKKAERVPEIVTAGGDTIAVRVPDHPVPRLLIERLEMPLTGTSANISGEPVTVTASEVLDQFCNCIDYIISAGPAPAGTESTIVDISGEKPRLLREGVVSEEQLEEICRF